jgi:hypothetical protein
VSAAGPPAPAPTGGPLRIAVVAADRAGLRGLARGTIMYRLLPLVRRPALRRAGCAMAQFDGAVFARLAVRRGTMEYRAQGAGEYGRVRASTGES